MSQSIAFITVKHPRYKYRLTVPHKHLMHHFIPLKTPIKLKGGWARMSLAGQLIISDGYMWDGPSGPALDTLNMGRASLIHDVVYQLIAAGLLPKRPWKRLADQEFRTVMRQDGVPGWRVAYAYWAVRLFGGARDKYTP